MSTDEQLKHRGHVLHALHHLHRAAQLHEITGKEQLKFVDGQCPDTLLLLLRGHALLAPGGQAYTFCRGIKALGLLKELRHTGDRLSPLVEAALAGYRNGERPSGGIPAMVEGLIDIVLKAVEATGNDDAVVTAFDIFVGHSTSDKNRPAGAGQAPKPATDLEGGAA